MGGAREINIANMRAEIITDKKGSTLQGQMKRKEFITESDPKNTHPKTRKHKARAFQLISIWGFPAGHTHLVCSSGLLVTSMVEKFSSS